MFFLSNYVAWLMSVIVSALVIKYFWDRRWLYYLSFTLPGPIGLPLLGNALTFFCKEEEFYDILLKKVLSKYPHPMRMWVGQKFTIIFSEVEHVEEILNSNKLTYKDDTYRFIQPFSGESLISGSGPKWKSSRKAIAPMYGNKYMEGYMELLNNHAEILVNKLNTKVYQEAFDVKIFMQRCYADAVNDALFGTQTNFQNCINDTFLHTLDRMYELIFSRMVKVWYHFDFLYQLSSFGKEWNRGIKEVFHNQRQKLEFLKKKRTMNTQVESGAECYEKIRPIIDQILDIREDNHHFATDEEMIYHINTLYTASEDTMTSITSFTILLLGMYPEIQKKIVDEIHNVIGKAPRRPEFKELSKLTYLDMCLKDVLRLFPIAPLIMRKASEDMYIGKYYLPKDCPVVLAINNIHRNPKYWHKPDEFYPEHFLPEFVAKRHPYAFIPFSAGYRSCIGKGFALMGMKAVLINVLHHYVIKADGVIDDIKLKSDISVRSIHGYKIQIEPR